MHGMYTFCRHVCVPEVMQPRSIRSFTCRAKQQSADLQFFFGNGAMSQGPQSKIRKPECVEKENVRGSTIRSKCDRAHRMREINGV